MRNRLSDSDNMAALASRGAIGTAAYVRVHWGQQHADWKSMDTMDGTEITFAFLLEDVARYWGVPADECALCHADGALNQRICPTARAVIPCRSASQSHRSVTTAFSDAV